MNSQQAKASLSQIEWREGLILPVTEGPYRHRVLVHCSANGRQKAMFANGEHNYFGYIELVDGKGQWIQKGVGLVPVLPDGRLIMVIEQRPPQSRYPDRPTMAMIAGKEVDLAQFGPHSSLEFPGGAVDSGEGLRAGFLRELVEETGVEVQSALHYSCLRPAYPYGCDLALEQYRGVVFLSGLNYEPHVASDGGLNVVALEPDEVEYNIHHGVIRSVQAALLQWYFYREVRQARDNPVLTALLQEAGYLAIEKVQIVKPK